MASYYGHTDCVIALTKAKANADAKNDVRVGLAGWMVMCARWSQGGDIEGVLL